jgi:TRAP-type transport system periplasmic protein
MNMTRILAAAALSAVGLSAGAQELRLGDFQSTTHIVSTDGTVRQMDAVTEATDGEITFSHFPSEQGAKAAGLLDAVTSGILDAALIGTIYHGETLPMNSIVGLPGFYDSAVEGTEALQEMMVEGPLRDELLEAGVVPIFAFVLPPYQVLGNSRLGGPQDWQSLDIRTSGSTQAMTARSLGAVGISMAGPEIYTAVERGRLDGILFPLASVPGYNLQEVVSHISTNGSFGGYSFVMVVRQDLFEGLTEAQQQAMIDTGKEVALHVAQAQDDSISALTEEWSSAGVDMYQFTDEELATIDEALADVATDWVERIGGGSEEAQELLSEYRALTSD